MQTKEEKKAYKAKYYAANLEKISGYQAVYRAANSEKISAASKVYQADNSERIKVVKAAWRSANREKIRTYVKARYAANRGRFLAECAAYRAANPEKVKACKRAGNYGLSPEAFQLMILMQKNACAICKETFSTTPAVDHCHQTGEVRGLLCGRCNKGLGLFRDSIAFLKSAEEYLQG